MRALSAAISRRVEELRPTAVNRILAEVKAFEAEGRKPVSLMRGEPDLKTPPHIVEAAFEALRNGRTGYPDNRGEPRLREAVAAKLARDNDLNYDPGAEILVTTGATFGIQTALTSIVDLRDEVMLPDPVYDAYHSPIRLAGAVPRAVAAKVRDGRFTLTAEALERAWNPACKALLLNTPWNPVGTVLRRDELEAIAGFVLKRDMILLSDEIYEAITYDGVRHVSPASLSAEVRARCVLINSLSKTYSMTGWRVGYVAAPKVLADAMLLVLQQSSRGPATFVQDAAAVALAGPQDCVAEMQAEYARRSALVMEALSGLRSVRLLPPEGGFFAMVDARAAGLPSDVVRRKLLAEHGVVVVDGAAYGEAAEGTLRVSFAGGGENLKQGLGRLREGLARL